MAEFVEVLKNASRICNKRYCKDCPLYKTHNGYNMECSLLKQRHPEEYEAIVMKWAKEHPVQTNKDKLMELVASAFGEDVANDFTELLPTKCRGFKCPIGIRCNDCKYKRFWEKEYGERINETNV